MSLRKSKHSQTLLAIRQQYVNELISEEVTKNIELTHVHHLTSQNNFIDMREIISKQTEHRCGHPTMDKSMRQHTTNFVHGTAWKDDLFTS